MSSDIYSPEFYPDNPFSGAHFVPPAGRSDAPIVIIGEAPGAKEDELGKPFMGGAGNILNTVLNQCGIRRDSEVYLTNVLKYRPPGNKITPAIKNNIIPQFSAALQRELAQLRPKVIVPMGNTALAALGFRDKITQIRGTVHPYRNGRFDAKVFPTFHPAYILRQYQEFFTLQRDMMRIKAHSRGTPIKQYREVFNINPTAEDVQMFAFNIKERIKSGIKVSLAIDLETYYGDADLIPIKLIGIALNETNVIVVPFITQAGQLYWQSREQAIPVIQAIGDLLEDPQIEKVFHNALFDVRVLMNHGFKVVGPIYDTMLAQYLVYHPSPHDLGYLASIYSEYPPWKLDKTSNNDKEFREYNARDCAILHIIRKPLDEDVASNGVGAALNNLLKVIIPTCRMMLNGISIDMGRYKAIEEKLVKRIAEIETAIRIEADDFTLNINSPKQLSDLLFKKLKLKSSVKTASGALSTGSDVLNRLSLRYPENKIVSLIIEHRNVGTQYKTFIKNLYIHKDNRVRSTFSLHTAVTGRFSSKNPNLQNLPSRADNEGYIRGMYAAPPGKKIVAFDYSQIELMIFAVIAGDTVWLEGFRSGADIHALNAEALIGYYDPKYRTFIKNFIYGFIYGSEGGEIEAVAPKELIQKISIRDMLQNLANSHPWLFEYRREIEADIMNRGYIINAYGRRRYFFPRYNASVGRPVVTKADLRSAYNYPIQSTAADLMHEKFPQVDEILNPATDKLILQLHDAFYIETDEDRVPALIPAVKDILETPVTTPRGLVLNMLKTEAEYGDSLSGKELQKWK